MFPLKSYLSDIIYLFFPETCAACRKALYNNEKWICSPCSLNLPYLDNKILSSDAFSRIFWGRVPVEKVWPYMEYKKGLKVQKILHQLKYRNQPELGTFLGELAAKKLLTLPSIPHIDCIIPVPMHYKKRRSRGYNQAEFIAEGYSNILKIPVKKEVIAKEKETTSQTRKNRFIRYQNAQDVFKIKDSTQLKQLRSILIIDDVITTGATIEALINCILTENPEIKLYVATLAAA